MTAAEHQQLVREREHFKAQASAVRGENVRLRNAISRHRRDVQGPGPAANFGAADARLWDALDPKGARS